MAFKEISESNMLDDFVQEIDLEGSFADIAVDVGNGEYINSNVNLDELYEDTLECIENIQKWSSWKGLAEIDMERARYLLSADDMLEEMLGKT
ncbi:MAG: hypothetical protein ABOK23_13715 [Candidatus Methanoperedens sp.]|nr:hypothetical protein [Candidatus Methanoperedens sp.]MCZ7396264.1 hypothetical protein [Candidatus Methanoperedens sp.]